MSKIWGWIEFSSFRCWTEFKQMHGNDWVAFTSLSLLKPTFAKINNMKYNSRTLIYQNKRGKVPWGLWIEQSPKVELRVKTSSSFILDTRICISFLISPGGWDTNLNKVWVKQGFWPGLAGDHRQISSKPDTHQWAAASVEGCCRLLLSPSQETASPPGRQWELAPRTASQVCNSWGSRPAPQEWAQAELVQEKGRRKRRKDWKEDGDSWRTYSKKKETIQEELASKCVGGGIREEGEASQSPELIKNSFCSWSLSWYLSSIESKNNLPALMNSQTQSPKKSIRIPINHPETSLHLAMSGTKG